jgi:hypothetical protein
VTTPEPVPLELPETVTQEARPETLHEHPDPVWMVSVTVPPAAGTPSSLVLTE